MLFEALLWNTQKYTCLTGLKSVLIFTCFPNIDSWEWKLSIDTTSESNQSTEIQNSSIQWFALFVFVCFFFFPVDRPTNYNKPYRWKEYGVGYLVQTFLKLVENYLTENIQVEFFFSLNKFLSLLVPIVQPIPSIYDCHYFQIILSVYIYCFHYQNSALVYSKICCLVNGFLHDLIFA